LHVLTVQGVTDNLSC